MIISVGYTIATKDTPAMANPAYMFYFTHVHMMAFRSKFGLLTSTTDF